MLHSPEQDSENIQDTRSLLFELVPQSEGYGSCAENIIGASAINSYGRHKRGPVFRGPNVAGCKYPALQFITVC